MIKLIIITLILLFTINSYSQSKSNPDSLKNAIEKGNQKDSAFIDALIKYARTWRGKNIDTSIFYYEKAIETSAQQSNTYLSFKSNHGIGICYGIKGDYVKAIEYFNQALKFAKSINNQEAIGDCYNTFGIIYKRMSDYQTSAEYYKKALLVYDSAKNESGIASANSNLGVLFDLMKEKELAKKSYQKALDYYTKNNKQGGIATIQSNLAVLHIDNQQIDSAIILLKKVLNYARSEDEKTRITSALINLGNCYIKINKLDTANTLLDEALQLAEQFDLKQSLTDVFFNLSTIYLKRGLFEKSLMYAEKNKKVSKMLKSQKFLADSEFLLSKIYEEKRDYKKALEHYKNYKQFRDSIFEENKVKAFKSQQVKMEVFEKDKKLEEKSLKLTFLDEKLTLEYRWKWLLAITTVLFLLLGALYYRKFKQKQKYSVLLEDKNAEIKAQNEAIEEINLQLESKMLRAQINPHFIFNALSAIQHFIITNDKKSALKFLSKFSSLLRQVLESSINVNMLLKDEIELIKIYLELEALRFSDGFEYDVSVDERLDIYMYEIPTLLIQPFIENSIIHGLLPKKNNRKLNIHFADNDQSIKCIVEDNGVGRKKSAELNKEQPNKQKSRGISLTEKRLSLLADNYDFHTHISYNDLIDDNGSALGTRVIINIPKP